MHVRRRVPSPRSGFSPCLGPALLAGLATAASPSCKEQDRPDRLSDLASDQAPRTFYGSFHAPTPDAGAASNGQGGTSGNGGSAGETGGTSGSGTDPDCTEGADACASTDEDTETRPIATREIYEGACEADLLVQWGFMTYEATTPGDSSITFRVRAAPSRAELGQAAFIDLITASEALGTTQCTFAGPAPCPIDLFVAFDGAPLAHYPVTQIEAVLSPPSGDLPMPSVGRWQMTYSCTQAQ